MCEKILFIILMLLAIIHSEEISLTGNQENVDSFNFRLPRIAQDLLPHNEQRSTRNRSRRSIFLLVPLTRSETQFEGRQPRETAQKTKRCFDTPFRRNRSSVLSSPRKNSSGRRRNKNPDADIYEDAYERRTDNPYVRAKDASGYSSDSITSMEHEMRSENEKLRRILADKLKANDVIVRLNSEEQKEAECNTGKYVCYCSKQSCSQKSSKINSSQMLGSARKTMDEKSSHRRPTEYDEARSDPDVGVSQRKLSSQLYRERPRLPMSPIDSLPIHYYQYGAPHTFYAPVLYGIPSHVLPHAIGNRREPLDFDTKRLPYVSHGERQDHFVESSQSRSILRQDSQERHRCLSGENRRFEDLADRSILPLTSDNNVIFNEATEKDMQMASTDPKIEGNERSRDKYFPKLNTKSANNYADDGPTDYVKKTGFQPSRLIDSKEKSDGTEFSGSDKTIGEILEGRTTVDVENSVERTETIERSGAKILPKLITTISTNYVDSTAKPEMKNNPALYSASGTAMRHFNGEPRGLSHINAKTKPVDRSDFNSDYSETVVRNEPADRSTLSADFLKTMAGLFRPDYDTNGLTYPAAEDKPNNLGKNVGKSRDFSEVTTSSSPFHADTTIYEGKLISEECIKLFGRDVCAVKAVPRRIHTGVPQSGLYEYSTVAIPGYIVPTTTEESTTENYYANTRIGTTDANFASRSTISEMGKLNDDANENLESTSVKLNAGVNAASQFEPHRFGERIYDRYGAQRNSYENKSSGVSKNERIPKKNAMGKITNEAAIKTTANERNKLLGKSKSRTNEALTSSALAPNHDERLEIASPAAGEKSLYSTKSRGFNEETTISVKIDSDKSIHRQNASTIPDHNPRTEHNFEEENAPQMQDKNSLPEIMQMRNMKSVLSTPQIDAIVKRVKDFLPGLVDKSAKDFGDERSCGLIRNILRRLLQDFESSHRQQPSPIAVEEHQFKHGQWRTDLVTLSPGSDFGEVSTGLKSSPGNVEYSLESPAIASQTNSRIVQGSRNCSSDEERGKIGAETDDSKIDGNTPSNTPQASERSSRTDASMRNDESQEIKLVTDGQDTNINNISRTASARNEGEADYKVNEDLGNRMLDGTRKLDEKGKEITMMKSDKTVNYQKVKALESIPNLLNAPEPSLNLPESHEENKSRYIEEVTPSSLTTDKGDETKENVTRRMYDDAKQTDVRDDDETKLDEKVISRHDSSGFLTTAVPSDLIKLEEPAEESKSALPEVTTTSSVTLDEFREGDGITPYCLTSRTEEIPGRNEVGTKNADESSRHEEEMKDGKSDERTAVYQKSILFGNDIVISPTMKRVDLLKPDEYSKTHVSQETSARTNEDSYTTEETVRNGVSDRTTYICTRYNQTVKSDIPQGITRTTANDSVRMSMASERSDLPMNGVHEVTNATTGDTSSSRKDVDAQGEEEPSTLQTSRVDMRETTRTPLTCTFLAESGDIPSSGSAISNAGDKIDGDEITAGKTSDKTLHAIASDPASLANNVTEYSVKHNDDDSAVMRAKDGIDEPSINYYSQNNRILDYIRNHPANNENEKLAITTATANLKQESSPDYARLSKASVEKNADNSATTGNLIWPTDAVHENRGAEIILPLSSTDGDLSRTRGLVTGDVIKTHEVTTETQKTYAKTTYFRTSLKPDENLTDNSPSPMIRETENRSNNANLIGNESDGVANITVAANRAINSTTTSDDNYFLQLFPSSTTTSERDIAQLERSQLYYINDNVKIPLEIRKLKDGSYALSISKGICEEIMKKTCPCCVPLQGHVLQTAREDDARANNVEEDSQPVNRPSNITITKGGTPLKLMEEEEEDRASEHLPYDRIKRHFVKNATISMPVLDFARKYNLSLDLDEEKRLLDEVNWRNASQNHNKSLTTPMKRFELDQPQDKDAGNTERKEEEINIREKEETLPNIKNFTEIFKEENGKPYRYQRNVNSLPNKGVEVTKTVLYWLKSLFV